MRILHVSSGNLYGGIETMLVTMARHRGECADMEQEFAPCFDARLAADLRETGAAVHVLGDVRISRVVSVWRARRQLIRVLQATRYDAVICHGPWVLIIFASVIRALGVPLVLWAHDAHLGKHWIERLAARQRPDRVIANSEYSSGHVASWLRGVPRTVIHCPVDVSGVRRRTRSRADVRGELDTPADAVVIVLVGRMEAWKGQENLLGALGILRQEPGWNCWIVGGPQRDAEAPYLIRLKQIAGQLAIADRVRFAGQRADVADLLAASDIYCQPNASAEPFGISLIEALSHGLPVITSAMGGALEIVNDSCGVLVRPGDVALVSDAIAQLVANHALRRRLGDGGAARAHLLCDPAGRLRELETEMRRLGSIHQRDTENGGAFAAMTEATDAC